MPTSQGPQARLSRPDVYWLYRGQFMPTRRGLGHRITRVVGPRHFKVQVQVTRLNLAPRFEVEVMVVIVTRLAPNKGALGQQHLHNDKKIPRGPKSEFVY